MFPCRYGRRNVVNRCSVVNVFPFPPFGVVGGGLLVQILGSGRGACFVDVCGWVTSPRPISTGRLGITAVYLRPINPVVYWGPYPVDPVGNLILKRASRLDAFSGYHFRT